MWENKLMNKRQILTFTICGFLLGAPVQVDVAESVAHSIFQEHKNLHNRDDFNISNIETITNGEQNLIYIFHLNPEDLF